MKLSVPFSCKCICAVRIKSVIQIITTKVITTKVITTTIIITITIITTINPAMQSMKRSSRTFGKFIPKFDQIHFLSPLSNFFTGILAACSLKPGINSSSTPQKKLHHLPLLILFGLMVPFLAYHPAEAQNQGTEQTQSGENEATEQKTTSEQTDLSTDGATVVAEIDDQQITLDELSSYYMRNSTEETAGIDELKEFLPLYTDYKLKLTYGLDNGLDKESSLLEEFEQYARQASYSYWLEQEVKDQLFETFKERSAYERKAYHLLQRLSPNASPTEEQEARTRLLEAKQKFLDGTPMEDLDPEYSTQLRGRSAGGQLPWFSAGNTVKEFEDALYALEPDEISDPVRSQFGYHLIYLQDVREKEPERLTRHIYIQPGDSAEVVARKAWEALEAGRTWEEVVQEYTQDGGSKGRDGLLGWIHHGLQYSEAFLDEVYAADPGLPYSSPVQTNYGFHILRIDSVKAYQTEEQMNADLREKLENIPGYGEDKENVLELIANRGNFSMDENVYNRLAVSLVELDSLSLNSFNETTVDLEETLIQFAGDRHNSADFITWLKSGYGDIMGRQFRRKYVEEYRDYLLESKIIEFTRVQFPAFDEEVENYLHGLIVFNVSDEHIWNPSSVDSVALRSFHKDRADEYVLPERYDYLLMASVSDSILSEAIRLYDRGTSLDDIQDRVPQIQVSDRVTDYLDEEPGSYLVGLGEGQRSDTFTYRSRSAVIYLKEILPSRVMTFDEAFNRVANDYQPVRERQFRDRLNSLYTVNTYPERIQ